MKKRLLSLALCLALCLGLLPVGVLATDGGGVYVLPGGQTEGGGGTYISGEDTRTEIRCVSKPDSIGRGYDGTTDGSTIPIDLTFTDGTATFTLKEGTGFTAKKTFDSADAGNHTVTVEITLIGETAKKYKLKAGEETFTIGGFINKAYPKLNVSLSRTTCTVGEKILPLLSVEGAPEGAAVTYYYTQYKSIAGDSDYEGNVIPAIDESTAISSLDEEGNNTYYVYAKTAATQNYEEERSTTVELTVSNDVASVMTSDGVITNYTSLDNALDAVKDGDTITLLSDAAVTRCHSLSTAFTLKLNGKTATTEPNTELYLHARVIVQDSSTGKTGGMAGTYLLNVQSNGDLIIRSGTFNGRIAINDGKLTINGGTFNQEVALPRGDSDSVFFSGGTFANIWYPNSSGSFLDLLAAGYAFYDNDGKLVNVAEITGMNLNNVRIWPHQHTFTNGACACGYTCPHTLVDANGACEVCKKQFAASVTAGEDVTYYDTFGSALFYATRNDGCTLKLLADVTGTRVMINNPFIFDLNGHNVDQGLSTDAKATIKDSGTTKGRIGKVTVSDTKVPDLTLGDLLEEGYAFKYGNDYWANDSYLQTTEGSSVTVEKAPIQSVNVYAKDKNNQKILTIAYGATGEVTLVSSCKLSETSGENLSCAWYKLTDDTAIPPLDGATGTSYTLPADLPAGKHTYWVTFTSDGYSKSAEITVTVTPISLEDAEVTVQNPTYNGMEQGPEVTVKLGEKTLVKGKDFSVFAEKQTNAGSYKLTISGQNNYTGEIKDVAWKIEPIKIDSFMVSSDIFKTYDGTAAITKTPEEWAKVLTFKTLSAYDIVNVPSDAYTISDASFIENRNGEYFDSPDAGEKYGIFFKITLKSSNYVLQNYYDDEPAKSKEYAQSGAATFTITKAPALDTQTGTLTVANNHKGTYTFDLKALLPTLEAPKSYGSISYGTPTINLGNYYTEGAKIEDGVLSVPINAVNSTEEKGIGTITVVVTTENYNDITLTLNVSAANKKVPTGTPTLSKNNITYGDTLSGITLSGSMKDGEAEVTGTFTWENPNEVLTAGKHQAGWVFTPTDSAHYIEVTDKSEVTVDKATPSGTPSYTAITESAKTLEDAHLAVGTIQPEGFIQWVDADGNEIIVSTEVKANTAYTWKFVPTDTDNYNFFTGTITLWHKSSSGSSSGSVTPGTKTDTVKNPDGSTTKTETKADGSKTETTTASSGGGSTGTTVTKTDAKGNTTTEASAKLSDQDVKEAQEKGEAVTVPVKGISAAKDANAATKIKIDVPNNANKTTVEIPVENVTSGTVAVIVHEDGTEELVKDSKPTEHGVQLELSGSTTVKIIDNSKTFDDTKDHWSRDEVNFVAARELFNGVGGNQFGVSQPMTRGMVNTVLARLADVDTTPGQGQAWYEVGTDWAKKNGISDGTNPTAPVTREQLATLLYRYAGSPSVSGTLHAADAASVSDYAEDALLWANQNGIVNGVGSNTIAPKDNAQRAQVAAMLARYLQNQ